MPARPIAASAPDLLSRIRIVLVQPQGAANIGAAARAMKNMGLRDMALVGTSRRRVAAAAMTAVRAVDILDGARRVRSIADAIADCNLVVGTSGQGGVYRAEPETPDEIAHDLLEVARAGRIAILFGPEHHGLTRDDLRFCHRLICIDSAAECPSINLAQAVLLVCYELRRHAFDRIPVGVAHPPARADELQRLEREMKGALLEVGFLNPQNPDRILSVLRRMLGRAVVRPFEAQVMLSLARRMRWSASAAAAAKEAGLRVERAGEPAVDEPAANG